MEEDSFARAQRTTRLKRNLFLIPVARALNMALLGQAVFNLFWLHDIGLDVQKIFTLQVINSISVVSLELPSGITSDTLGRKKTLIIACVLKVAAFLAYGIARSFITCCVAEFLLAAGSAAWSGTDTAILYETAAELELSAEALNRESSNVLVSQLVEGSCAILGGLLATWISVRFAVCATTIPFVIAGLVTCRLIEPKWTSHSQLYESSRLSSSSVELEERVIETNCVHSPHSSIQSVKEHVVPENTREESSIGRQTLERQDSAESLGNIDTFLTNNESLHDTEVSNNGLQCFQLFHHQWVQVIHILQMSQVCEAISCSIFVSCATYTAVWFYQLLFERANMSLNGYGPSWAVLNFAVAVGAYMSPIMYQRLGLFLTQSLLGLWLIVCFTALGLWISPWVVVVGCLLNIVRGINQPMFITHLNHLLPSSCRATMGSVYSLGTRLVFSAGALILGFVSRVYNLTVACILCGLFYGSAAMIFGFLFHRLHKHWNNSFAAVDT